MDIRAQQAREQHQLAQQATKDADRHRASRDRLVLLLRKEDPKYWTHERLARAVGCSPELISVITRRGRR